jgi:acetyltransferase-like isoleucine patch superfamily enzyme
MKLVHRLKNPGNPHNLTRIHLRALVRKHAFTIGDDTFGNPKIRFVSAGTKLSIGRYCSIADGVEILLGGNHRTDFVTTYPFGALGDLWRGAESRDDLQSTNGDVIIGHDVWLGSQSLILSGVTIGHGAVVAARAVVTKDVPPYAIVGGNPAKLIRYRFDETTIKRLLVCAWWNLPREQIVSLIPLLQSADIEAFLRVVEHPVT